MTKLSIIILSFNTKELTLACIGSIIKQYNKQLENQEFEVIIVDNGSSDDTVATINKQQSTNNKAYLKTIENRENYGFSKGNNIGAKKARGKYLFFLNSDTAVKDVGLVGMVEFLDAHKAAGILGARLSNLDGRAQASSGVFYNLLQVFFMLAGIERLGFLRASPKQICKVDWVSGGAMMIKQSLFEKLSGFDEAFFMYMEDMELCFRAKKLGFFTWFYPNVTIVHKELASSNRSFAVASIYKGLLYFYRKHKSYPQYVLVKLLLVVKAYSAIVIGKVFQNSYLTATYKKALALCL